MLQFSGNFVTLACITVFGFQWQLISASDNLVTLYTQINNNGQPAVFSASQCGNVPSALLGDIAMVQLNGQCARLHSGKNCTGDSIEVRSHAKLHNLSLWNFDKQAVSVGPCLDSCRVDLFRNPISTRELHITIQNNIHPRGKNLLELAIKGCTPVPQNFIKSGFSVYTVDVNADCVQLYNNLNCETTDAGTKYRIIQLRSNSPSNYDLGQWNFTNIKAISDCSFKCKGTWITTTNIVLVTLFAAFILTVLFACVLKIIKNMVTRNALNVDEEPLIA